MQKKLTVMLLLFVVVTLFAGLAYVRAQQQSDNPTSAITAREQSENFGNDPVIVVTVDGKAEWFYFDDHGLDEERFGTPQSPKGLDIIPEENRKLSDDGNAYLGLKDGQVFSRDRATVTGTVRFTINDKTPVDYVHSADSGTAEGEFFGPSGERFRVVMTSLLPAGQPVQTFGGVVANHLVHGHTGVGIDKLFPEFAYALMFGIADVYRDGTLIAENRFFYVAASERARILNEDFEAGRYNSEDPLGPLIVHFVVLPRELTSDGNFVESPIPTGVIGPNGKEQDFFHVNFFENIQITGNRLFEGIVH